ncbi:hypothetical protein EDD80_106192 [Anseongella ginsenosidimutans]|uniref:Uncharacterized protein n=2 Tax=Anseongella ginsenosidimutans TaxID=496056 RepID=A0A4R3KT21_9SPHI|nr:hypothetical protein EDD80_106192 [Anseongella ginsenosidimutans]
MAMLKNYLSMLVLGALVLALPACNDDDDGFTPPPSGEAHPFAEDAAAIAGDKAVILYEPVTADRTLSSDSVYFLDGFVFVNSGTLTIEPGTVIMAFESPSAWAENVNPGITSSTLIVTREAKINAVGTEDAPIIFTSVEDQEALDGTVNLTPTSSGLWSGLIVLGKAPIHKAGASETTIEGLPNGFNNTSGVTYGGNDAAHSSGNLEYVSIRFTGSETSPGEEIQGLTLGGVGSGTTIENIDIFVSSDDGIEIFGGTVNIKNISVVFAEDDSYDFDLGWKGYGQFLFALQRADAADHGGEWDGADPDDAPLYTTARIYNATFIGKGAAGEVEAGNAAILMREGGALSVYNSIIADFNRKGIQVEDLAKEGDAFDRLVNEGENAIGNNLWFTLQSGSMDDLVLPTEEGRADDGAQLTAYLKNNANVWADPQLGGISRDFDSKGLDPRPAAAEAKGNVFVPSEPGVSPAAYKGAFDPAGELWIAGWSSPAKFGILK